MLLSNKLQVVTIIIVIYSHFINNLLYPYNVINTYRIYVCVFCIFELIGSSHELIQLNPLIKLNSYIGLYNLVNFFFQKQINFNPIILFVYRY